MRSRAQAQRRAMRSFAHAERTRANDAVRERNEAIAERDRYREALYAANMARLVAAERVVDLIADERRKTREAEGRVARLQWELDRDRERLRDAQAQRDLLLYPDRDPGLER